jgi:hypothetical protein
MASSERILVLGTTYGGGNWPPLSAVTVGLHQAGHVVRCFGDANIAQELTSAAIPVEVVPAEATLAKFMALWAAADYPGPAPFRPWADICVPLVRDLVRDFRPARKNWRLLFVTDTNRGVRLVEIRPVQACEPDANPPSPVRRD